MDCFDKRHTRPMTLEYLAGYGKTAKNLLIHYDWLSNDLFPVEDSYGVQYEQNLEKNFERILEIYRGQATLKFIGFSHSTEFNHKANASIGAFLEAERLPKQCLLPQAEYQRHGTRSNHSNCTAKLRRPGKPYAAFC